MTFEEMQTECDAICAAMIDKGLRNPRVNFEVHSGSTPYVYMFVDGKSVFKTGQSYSFSRSESPRKCFVMAWQVVQALPDFKVAVAEEYTRKLADAVDFAVEHALPDAAVSPVRDAIRVVHDVLLPAPEAAE